MNVALAQMSTAARPCDQTGTYHLANISLLVSGREERCSNSRACDIVRCAAGPEELLKALRASLAEKSVKLADLRARHKRKASKQQRRCRDGVLIINNQQERLDGARGEVPCMEAKIEYAPSSCRQHLPIGLWF